MAGPLQEPVLALLDTAKNHGDLAVKLSSLKQAKGILLSLEPSLAAELLPYLFELQSSPEGLIRKSLIEIVEEIWLKAMGHSSMLMPFLLASLKDSNPVVARQSIVSGINIFCSVLEELSLQFQRRGIVERWLEELWTWMVRFKDDVIGILLEAGSVGTRLLAMKFLETCVLLFSSDSRDSGKPNSEVLARSARNFNVSLLVGGHPILDPVALMSESNRCLGILLDLLQSARSLPGLLTISTVNCLAVIARKRPLYYSSVLSALLDFDSNFESMKGSHKASIQYSLRTAYLGFLRCTYPAIVESRDRLLRALRSMNAGDAADQVIRQIDKMIRNSERASRDAWLNKDDQPSSQLPISGDLMKKRSMALDNEESAYSHDVASKRVCYGPNINSVPPVQISDSGQNYSVNGVCHKIPLLENDLNPVEQMIAMIGALIAEGERGSESLEILISQIHPDLLADIVITNMKHLPQNTPPLTKLGSLLVAQQGDSSSGPTQVVASNGPTFSVQSSVLTSQIPLSSSNAVGTSLSETSTSINVPAESKRDPRRDPRRLDPRRLGPTVGVALAPTLDNTNAAQSDTMQSEFDATISLNNPLALPVVTSSENISVPSTPKTESDLKILESSVVSASDQSAPREDVLDGEAKETCPVPEIDAALDIALSPVREVDEDSVAPKSSDIPVSDEACNSFLLEADQLSPSVSNTPVLEDTCSDLPLLPLYIELTEDQQRNVRKLAVERVIESYKHFQGTDCSQMRTALLSRLVAQIDADDDVVVMMQKHIVSDYQHQKGHELVMHVLYHLHTLTISDAVEQPPSAALIYEKFLLGVAKSLLDSLPASDKSFSRLLSEVPFLPNSVMELLEKVCHSDSHCGKDVRDGDRVTQGLGTVWTLILGRPLDRQACLEIALKCAVHPQDDIRTKAIRLVANKLYVLNYISEKIEQFATSAFLSAVDQRLSDAELQSGTTEHRTVGEISNRESQETSISGSQISDLASGNDYGKDGQSDTQSDSPVSFSQAQRLISLFFALCTKRPCLLQTVFDNYARSPKAVKQAVHRHIPILIRALGSSYSELLRIISDPPEGSENLLTQVLHVLFEGTAPSSDLIESVKHIYETKLKDVAILIPVLSSLSKNEVLPIFPRLVDLPLDKFQRALAHILQGSAHTGPALTPAEVLVAIHDINPEKDGLALKKIMDACSACFEQRTVFTQQVLAKALNQMVDQTPLPLLFMRTVIQAIDAFPTLVDFVMEILSKLVSKQVWRMPKLWVGFLKCVSQTQPHSFHVLLQLPSPQLENALNKYANLRGSLAAFANQPSIKATLPRSTLVVLGLVNEAHVHQPHLAPSLHASDTSSSVHGATLT